MAFPPDAVAPFQLENAPARGRYAQLSAGSIDPILRRHAYPRAAALLLGEALCLASLVGALFKVEGRLVLQAEGAGPITLLVADYAMDGGLRGYARLDERADLSGDQALPIAALLGPGAILTLSLDQGPDTALMQSVVALEGDTLSACMEAYFARSEQTPTAIRVAIGEDVSPGAAPLWRAGGALVQRIAADATRPAAQEDWETAQALFATVSDHELIDPALGPERVLYRLFHEVGVRLGDAFAVVDRCGCDGSRVVALLSRYPPEDLTDFVEPDGMIHAKCQFCARGHVIDPNALQGTTAKRG